MRFEHPELLYALLLLIIPVIVHLFRLRRFQKEDFTNVKFLKKVIQETRKSSRLKKFLLLITRLFLIASLVLAFAQPYITASETALKKPKTLIYLDNSFSMQSRGEQASLFQNAINDLIINLEADTKYSLITNTGTFEDRTGAQLRSDLQEIELSAQQLDFRELNLRAERFFQDQDHSSNQFIVISDFQQQMDLPSSSSENYKLNLIQLQSENNFNLSIDSAYIAEIDPENFKLKIQLSGTTNSENTMISVYDGENLLGRNSANIINGKGMIQFSLQNKEIRNGNIRVEDNGLNYDDVLYFSKQHKNTIQVVAISAASANFLKKIYTEPEFQLSVFDPEQIDLNTLNQANLIILNELPEYSTSLASNLGNEFENGTSLIIIPPVDIKALNSRFLRNFGFSSKLERLTSERLITAISFDHPLLQNVFEEQIQNFEYPKALSSFNMNSGNAVLKFQDGKPFLSQSGSAYLFSAALNSENSNFKNSPLIVPIFYQIGLQSLRTNALYYSANKDQQIDLPLEISGDQVVHLENEQLNMIPQQQNFSKKIEIFTTRNELNAGNYKLTSKEEVVGTLSFNVAREESNLVYSNLEDLENLNLYESIQDYFSQTKASAEITALWKWFVIFALIFLAIEMLLIKFLK